MSPAGQGWRRRRAKTRLAVRHRRTVVFLLGATLLASGCAAESARDALPDPATVSTDRPAESTSETAGQESLSTPTTALPREAGQARELVGMYGWDPAGGFYNAMWSGTLVLDAPCTYLDVSHQDGRVALTPQGDTLRAFVRLPEPLTRYDPAAGALWVAGRGPMATGDDIVMVGSEGWQIEWNDKEGDGTHAFESMHQGEPGCTAHVSFYAASMSPSAFAGDKASVDIDHREPISGLFPWDTEQGSQDVGEATVLTIEPPCVYAEASGRYFVRLPRPLVRFDPETNSIWFKTRGPFATGDAVTLQGGPDRYAHNSGFYEGGCSARGDWHATWMSPSSR